MRVLFLVLLIANLALFAIAQWNSSGSPAPTREELNPDKLRLLAPKEKRASEVSSDRDGTAHSVLNGLNT